MDGVDEVGVTGDDGLAEISWETMRAYAYMGGTKKEHRSQHQGQDVGGEDDSRIPWRRPQLSH